MKARSPNSDIAILKSSAKPRILRCLLPHNGGYAGPKIMGGLARGFKDLGVITHYEHVRPYDVDDLLPYDFVISYDHSGWQATENALHIWQRSGVPHVQWWCDNPYNVADPISDNLSCFRSLKRYSTFDMILSDDEKI